MNDLTIIISIIVCNKNNIMFSVNYAIIDSNFIYRYFGNVVFGYFAFNLKIKYIKMLC